MDLQQISDRLEIADVITRYTIAIDTGEWDLLDAVFTPDAAIDYTESGGIAGGIAEVKPWLAEMLPIFPQRMHTIGQVAVEPAPGRERASWARRPRWRRTSTTRCCCPRTTVDTRSWRSVASTGTRWCAPPTAGAADGCTSRSSGREASDP